MQEYLFKKGGTYRQCFGICAILNQRYAVGELLAIEVCVLEAP
jgi:hypothetical protein